MADESDEERAAADGAPGAAASRARLASAVMRPTDLALLRTPGVPTVSPGRPDRRRRRRPARPRGRRVPQPAVGGPDRRLGAGPAADLRRTGTARPGVLARTAAGWPT